MVILAIRPNCSWSFDERPYYGRIIRIGHGYYDSDVQLSSVEFLNQCSSLDLRIGEWVLEVR